MKIEFFWETIYPKHELDNGNAYFHTERAKVFGGWLIRDTVSIDDCSPGLDNSSEWKNVNISTVFVPDPNHSWEI